MGKVSLNRVGETSVSANGEKITIIAYRKAIDLDVQFEDGTILKGKDWRRFKNGRLRKEPSWQIKHKGERHFDKNLNKWCTILKYESPKNVTIQYDNEKAVKKTTFYRIIANENGVCPMHESGIKRSKIRIDQYLEKHLGKISIATNGQKMKIINYQNAHNIDVQFEDGTIVKNCQFSAFKSGKIKNPNYNTRSYEYMREYFDKIRQSKIGLENVNRIGLKMTIINVKRCRRVDIQFEDGVIVKDKEFKSFEDGSILHPYKRKHWNETYSNINGEQFTIIKCYKNSKYDVMFEDGNVVKRVSIRKIKKGHVFKRKK